MDPETARHLLEQKISVLNTAGNISMLWWVTTVVLCVSILAGVWKNKKNLPERKRVILLVGVAGLGFFLGVILYGISVVHYLDGVKGDISNLVLSLNAKADLFSPELGLFRRGMIIGTTSFAGVLILWIIMHVLLLLERSQGETSPPKGVEPRAEALSNDEPARQAQPNKSSKPTAS